MGRTLALLLILLPQLGIPSDLTSGLTYEHQARPGPLSIQILVVDPTRVSLQAARALNDGIGRETVSSMAARVGAMAAVSGESSAMIRDGRLMNSPSDAGKERPVSDAIIIMPRC